MVFHWPAPTNSEPPRAAANVTRSVGTNATNNVAPLGSLSVHVTCSRSGASGTEMVGSDRVGSSVALARADTLVKRDNTLVGNMAG